MGKKVMIVFEETEETSLDAKGNPGNCFNVYLDGDIEGITTTPEDQLPTAQWWGIKMFRIVSHYLKESGAVRPGGGK